MPTASVISPMMPPSASTSRTKCPLAIPPTAGLHDICAIRSTFSVNRAVFRPMRAAAVAASHPACPAPTTTTSNCSVNCICGLYSSNEYPHCRLELRPADIGEPCFLPLFGGKIPVAGSGFVVVSTCAIRDGRSAPVVHPYLQQDSGRNLDAG